MDTVSPKTVLIHTLNNPEMLGRIAERAKEIDPNFPQGPSSNALLMWLLLEQSRIYIPFGSTIPQVVATLMQPFPLGSMSLLHNAGWRSFNSREFREQAGDVWVELGPDQIPQRAGLVAKANPLGDFIYSLDIDCGLNWKPRRIDKAHITAWVGPT